MGTRNLNGERLRDMYAKMMKIRLFEEKADELFVKGQLPGAIHTSIGQEAVAVGVASALRPDDVVIATHRAHGHCLMKGVDVKGMFAELLGKKSGTCKGKGGSMHIIDASKSMLGANGIVGQQIPIATGAGMAIKAKGKHQVCACFFGDGASNSGVFHEALNLASLWKLPVIYVCENNLYAVSVPVSKSTCVKDIAVRAKGYDIPGVVVDGMDVIAVYEATSKAVERARKGDGPTLIECKAYRFMGHSRGDPAHGPYRTKEELESWKKKDPIKKLLRMIKLSDQEVKKIEEDLVAEIEEAVRFAQKSPYPGPQEALQDLYV